MVENKKIKISGVAVREGISRNGRKYLAKELKKFAPSLIGRPILKDHEGLTDNTIGKVTRSEAVENGKIVTYEGWIKEDGTGIVERIKDGRISEVSIGAMSKRMVKEKEDDDFVIPIDMESLELSTTPVPGVRGTTLITTDIENYTEKQLKEMINIYELKKLEMKKDEENKEEKENLDKSHSTEHCSEDTNNNERRINMEAKNNAESTKENVELETLKKELESFKAKVKEAEDDKEEAEKEKEEAEKESESLKETLRKETISRYTEKAQAKGLKVKDLSEANIEQIKFAIEMVDDMPEPKEEEEEEKGKENTTPEPESEPKEEEDKEDEEPKEKAKPKTKEANKNVSSIVESLEGNGYSLTQEDCSKGFAFYKHY